jgi:purine-binding chemotaxis protein CheW
MTNEPPRSRARRTRARSSQERGAATKSYVRFVVGETNYAFEVEHVREIVHPGPVTLLPSLPDSVAGVADHRGEVVPIVDLRIRFGMQSIRATAETRPEKWILMTSSVGVVGFVVDRVIDVVGTNEAPDHAPQIGGSVDRGIKGVIPSDEGLLFILDVERLAIVVKDAEGNLSSRISSFPAPPAGHGGPGA